ncbi:MAG: hypothetical protein RBT20_13850 [Syntrophales bacterium]|jgi:hypothetical protein|nr:hypothetical protein [Syntrophales bacterium]
MATEGWQKWRHPARVSEGPESTAKKHLSIGDTKGNRPPSAAELVTPATEPNAKGRIAELPSLEKLFRNDFKNLLRSYSGRNLGIKSKNGEKTITIGEQLYLDFPGKSKFLGYYIPLLPDSYDICAFMADEYLTTISDFESKTRISAGHMAEFSSTSQKELVFTGRIYIYHEYTLSHQQLADLEKLYRSKGVSVVFRGPAYLSLNWKP